MDWGVSWGNALVQWGGVIELEKSNSGWKMVLLRKKIKIFFINAAHWPPEWIAGTRGKNEAITP